MVRLIEIMIIIEIVKLMVIYNCFYVQMSNFLVLVIIYILVRCLIFQEVGFVIDICIVFEKVYFLFQFNKVFGYIYIKVK